MGINQLNGGFQINNTSFDIDVVNYTVPLNNTEIWSIINNSAIAHPFHIHDVQFYILDRNGSLPNSNELGRKDVVLIKPQETVRFIAKFENFADTAVPYMYHCHLLVHEDGGMMGQFVVKNFAGTSGIQNPSLENKVIAYPNPSEGKFTLEIPSVVNVENVSIYNIIGELVYVKNIRENNLTFDVQLPPGVYQIMIKTTSEVITSRIQINN
jgi:bilirubin oxidase